MPLEAVRNLILLKSLRCDVVFKKENLIIPLIPLIHSYFLLNKSAAHWRLLW